MTWRKIQFHLCAATRGVDSTVSRRCCSPRAAQLGLANHEVYRRR